MRLHGRRRAIILWSSRLWRIAWLRATFAYMDGTIDFNYTWMVGDTALSAVECGQPIEYGPFVCPTDELFCLMVLINGSAAPRDSCPHNRFLGLWFSFKSHVAILNDLTAKHVKKYMPWWVLYKPIGIPLWFHGIWVTLLEQGYRLFPLL